MKAERLADALVTVARPLRGMRGLSRVIAGAAVAVTLLACAAWWARLTKGEPVLSVLLLWVAMVSALLAGWMFANRSMRSVAPNWIASLLEESGNWRRGALTTVLDTLATGTSPSLHQVAEERGVSEVEARGAEALGAELMRARQLGRQATIALVLGAIALAAARPLQGAPARFWHPFAAWTALTAPVRLEVGSENVSRGERGTLQLTATGHRSATLFLRTPGEPWRDSVVTLDVDGKATFLTEPLTAELVARLEAGGHSSDEVRIGIKLPAFLGSFTVTARYPAYLGLESETLPLAGDTLVLPQGTSLDLDGRATVPLERAALLEHERVTVLTVQGSTFHGILTPAGSGVWRVNVKPIGSDTLDGEILPLNIRLLPDSVPVVEIPVPGADTTVGPALQLPLLITLHDDHGLSGARIEMHRGALGATTSVILDIGKGIPDRALLSPTLDLAAMGVRPGDTLYYQIAATDNSPARQRGVSRPRWVRVPTETELRQASQAAKQETAASFDSLVATAKKVQQQTEDLAKERSRADQQAGNGDETAPLSADAARKAEAIAKGQQQLMEDARTLQKAVTDLQRAAQQSGMLDSSFAAQLDEIRRLMRQADSPELREALAALQNAMKDLNPEATRDAMQDLGKKQAEFSAALQQARELFKRAAAESDLSNLSQQAKQLSQDQKDLNARLDRAAGQYADSAKTRPDLQSIKTISDEKALGQKADSLAASIDRSAQRMPTDSLKQDMQKAAKDVRDAGKEMTQAAKSAEQGKQQQAKEQTKAAEEKLDKVEQAIKEQKKELQQEMKEEVLRGLDRALAESSRLAERQMAMVEAFRRAGGLVTTRAEQSVIDDATGRLLAQVNTLAGMNALVPPQIGIALSAGRVSMKQALESVATLSPDLSTASAEAGNAVDALAFAAFAMLRAKERIGSSESGSGMPETMKELQQAAEQQGKAAQEAGKQMSSGDSGPEQMMQMAMQQRAVAQQLERLRAGGAIPGAGDLMKEAKELTRELEAGTLNRETVDRSQRLYKKLLDAGRQLQGEQDDDERDRKAIAAKDGAVYQPPALDPRLRLGASGIKVPGWESLQKLTPDERRRVLEYFQRLADIRRPQ